MTTLIIHDRIKKTKEKEVMQIQLRNGGCATIDEIDYKVTLNQRWTRNNMGVVTYTKTQKIYLHNLIAPYRRVSFKDGDRTNCRRSNLMRTEYKNYVKRKGGVCKFNNQFYIQRTVNGVKWHKNYRFGAKRRFKTENEAEQAAKEDLKYISSLTELEFIDRVKSRKATVMSTHDIISNWDLYDGREFSKINLIEEGIKNLEWY